MDALKHRTINALEHVICVSEDLLNIKITCKGGWKWIA